LRVAFADGFDAPASMEPSNTEDDPGDVGSPPAEWTTAEEGVAEADVYRSGEWYFPPETQEAQEYQEYQSNQWYPVQPAYQESGYQELTYPGPAYQDAVYEPVPDPVEPAPADAPTLAAGGRGAGARAGRSKKKTLSRRGVLAGAVAGGAAVAAARLLILEKPEVLAAFNGAVQDLSDHRGRLHNGILDGPQPVVGSEVVTQVVRGTGFPTISESLKTAQLLRRMAFGGTEAMFGQALAQGFQRTVDQLLATPAAQPPPFKAGEAIGTNVNLNDLQDWWLTHMVTTPTPFQERLTLWMASVFTSDYQKVELNNPFLIWQNRTWRDMALTDLRSILKRVSIDPAMLIYLDGNGSNGRGTPNQNYARELMELFSIGLVYKETDVTEGAKALSGWRVPRAADNSMVGIFDPNRHFAGAVSFLGRNQPMDLDAVIDTILAHPASAPFIANKFITEFVSPTPDPAYVNRIAANFRKSGFQMKTLVRDVLTSPEFGAQANFRSEVKSPMEFMVGAARATGANPTVAVPIIRNYARMLGHAPFDPPDVGGWPRNIAWLSPVSLMNRVNFVTDFVNGVKTMPAANAAAVNRFLDNILSPGTSQTIAQAPTDAAKWWSMIASPDAQLA
jgi:uncharacterized protein (DUF1800 family)